MSIYQDALSAGLKVDHHESDLYLEDTPKARALVEEHGWYRISFIVQPEHRDAGQAWLDIPFAYDPHWVPRRKP